ncbi:general secretion pathway protein GspL [Ideonella sp. B7]|uniref:type II secretion system protein GspL n=1 Tax=Ideonella benzenivorans TaxID=2831643 RepID=UPI001CEDFB6B|nr:type II secretion system protein GspL [Ideonella benzenivorans]MCA6218785.1 general secretion pathway protein GspL [Ideonella benzenivorans]
MSLLIVQLPARPRLSAQPADAEPAADTLDFAFSQDGRHLTRSGRCPVAELPAADQRVAVLAPEDISWHRITLPKASGPRLRQALAGLLEEALLDDAAELHFALPPQARAGESVWVAAVHRSSLQQQIARLEPAGLSLDRVVPGWLPDGPIAAHAYGPAEHPRLAWRDADGPVCLPLSGAGPQPLLTALLNRVPADATVHWSATPETAGRAAELAGQPVAAGSAGDWLLQAASTDWNLRQFDLAAQRRGQRALREALLPLWRSPRWRPARIGLAALIGIQLVGANVWAWQQRHALAVRQQAMTALLQQSFPQVKAVIDPPAQMQKEIDLLRMAAGKPGDTDLEPLLYASEAAWPPGRGPASALHFEPGRLTLSSPGWTPQEVDGFRSRLLPLGLDAEPSASGPSIVKARPGALPPVGAAPAGPPGPVPTATGPGPQARPVPATTPTPVPSAEDDEEDVSGPPPANVPLRPLGKAPTPTAPSQSNTE